MLALIVPIIAVLATTPTDSPTESRPAAIILNGEDAGEGRLEIEGDSIWIAARLLRERGLVWTDARLRRIQDEDYVLLSSLRPAVTYVFDEAAVALRLTAPPAAFAAVTAIRLPGAPPNLDRKRNASLFLNYAVDSGVSGTRMLVTELGARFGPILLHAHTTAASSRRPNHSMALIVDDERRRIRWRAGDGFAGANMDGRVVPMVGLVVQREDAIDPYFVRYSPVALAGASATPAVADVYVNGQLIARRELTPGTFYVEGLQPPAGASTARVVIRDAFGRSQELTASVYRGVRVLSPGLHEYRYSVGRQRWATPFGPAEYGGAIVGAEHRLGVTPWLTAGGRFERGPQLIAAESSLAFGVPFGELGVEFRRTSAAEGQGHAAGFSYNYRHPRVNAGLEARWSSPLAATLAEEFIRVRSQVLGWVGLSAPRLISGAFHLSSVVTDDGDRRQALTPSLSIALFRRVNLTTSVSRVASRHSSHIEALTGLTVPFGGRSSFTTSSYNSLGQTSGSLAVQRSLGPGPDWGYRLDANDNGLSSASLTGQTRVGRVQLRAEQWGGEMLHGVQVAGALVAAGGRVHFTSPVDDAFAVVRLEGLPGVRTFLNNQFVGRTNGRGELVVAGLTSYTGNAISVSREDIPADVDLASDAVLIAPSFRGGALVTLPATRTAPVTGRFLIAVEPLLVPSYGLARITTAASTITSPLDERGGFYFDALPPGAYVAIVEYFGRRYACQVKVPPAAFAVNLGVVRCDGRPAQEVGG